MPVHLGFSGCSGVLRVWGIHVVRTPIAIVFEDVVSLKTMRQGKEG